MRLVFAGTPEFAVPALRALHAAGHDIVGCLTQPDRPAGRGRLLTASPVKRFALEHQIDVAQPGKLASDEQRAPLRDWAPDALIVVAYGLILPRAVLDLPRLGCINIHASLLPRWRGAAPIQRAILAGDVETGVTIMQMEAGLDTGPMLLQRSLPIRADMIAAELHDELSELGAAMIVDALPGIAHGTLVARVQPEAGVTYASKLQKSEARIDWQQPALQIARQVRAFNAWPVAETLLEGQQLRIWRAQALANTATTGESVHFTATTQAQQHTPGTVLGLVDDALQVACGTGVLAIQILQAAGKRALSAREFVNARPLGNVVLG